MVNKKLKKQIRRDYPEANIKLGVFFPQKKYIFNKPKYKLKFFTVLVKFGSKKEVIKFMLSLIDNIDVYKGSNDELKTLFNNSICLMSLFVRLVTIGMLIILLSFIVIELS